MKTKTKTSKGNILQQMKKVQKKTNTTKHHSVTKKTEAEVRKNLENTMKLLQYRLNIKKENTNTNNTLISLSQSIYDIVQRNIPEKPKTSQVPTQDSSEHSSTMAAVVKQKQRSYSSHSNTIMQYFKQKFGDTTVADEQSVEKKLKALQALKKSQELSNKYNSQYNLSVSSIPDIGCDIGGKQVVIGKLRKKMQ